MAVSLVGKVWIHLPAFPDATLEPQKHTESSISIPSLGLFDTNNPVYDPAEEEFRRRMQRKKKRSGPKL